ncbi:MAG: ABC transporter permease [Ignavibacteria bacterium]|nr:ABC transporter permease [Bacteroidota bacterium]MSQ46054.1 ABC transporter permease [Ignavibacteria bacterium]
MTKTYAIARWEYLEKVKKKSFIASLLIVPLFMFGSIYIPIYFSDSEEEISKTFAIIDEHGFINNSLDTTLANKYKLTSGKPLYNLISFNNLESNSESQKKSAISQTLTDEIEGYLFIRKTLTSDSKIDVEFGSKNIMNHRDQERMQAAIEEIIFANSLQKAGYDYSIVKKYKPKINLSTVQVTSQNESKQEGALETFFSGYILNMLLLLLVMTTGQMMVRSLVEEKTNKLVEVLLSSCSPKELLTGKIIGLSILGLSMVGFWIILFVAATFVSSENIFSIESLNLILSVAYLVGGYFLFASLFIAIGSLSSSEQDAQQITGYLSMIIVIPLLFIVPVMQSPNALFVKILSYIPFFTSSLMMLRLSIQPPSTFEIISTLILLFASGYGMTIIAGKIFKVGILFTGKKPNFKELIRWIRMK